MVSRYHNIVIVLPLDTFVPGHEASFYWRRLWLESLHSHCDAVSLDQHVINELLHEIVENKWIQLKTLPVGIIRRGEVLVFALRRF